MPVTGSKTTGPEKGPGGGGRTTFRPPWVKEGATTSTPAAPKKAPWVMRAESTVTTITKENGAPPVKEAKLQSREIKVPVMTTKLKPVPPPLKPKEERRDSTASGGEPVVETKKEFLLEKPKLRHVESEPKEKSKTPNVLPEQPKLRPVLKKTPKVEEKPPPPFERKLSSAADRKIPAPPPPPPNGPNAPPPPPPPSLAPPPDFEKKPLTEKQKDVLDKLKTRARRRPDWSEMMKEVEDGKKLRHVECNDRSRPILTVKSMTKVDGQFVFETEKANVHNKLLQQIQSGIKLKPVKTNDRSKPFLEGLRKFRRQMTIEEQIQKSESRAALNEEPVESEDEMDDIDKLRDDLQSTKQMLALELRNKEAQERENKLLQAKIANLEAELEREKSKSKSDSNTSVSTSNSAADEALVNSLKKDAEEARKTCKELEKKYQQSAEQLDSARSEIEEHKRMIANLERKLTLGFNKSFSKSNSNRSQFGFCYSLEDSNDSDIYYEQDAYDEQGGTEVRRPSEAAQKESSPEPEIEESESESDEDEEKKAERLARRLTREVKMLTTKLQKLKDKQQAAQKERTNLKEAMKKNQALLKEETKRYKKLQKEVDKMAKMLHDDEEDEDAEEKDEEEEEEEEEEESESEEETETEESEEESGSETESESEDEDASDQDKKANLEPRIKKHEGRLNALKKGNYLLQTNVDRLLDEVNKMREQSASLQRDLDSVLSELG